MSFWGDAGIAEDVALSVCAFCDLDTQQQQQQGRQRDDSNTQQEKENCNKPQRVLIQNGTVYLNNLVGREAGTEGSREGWLGGGVMGVGGD